MAAASPWPLIHSEREALAADLAELDDAKWATPSLCGDWSVREVLGHMIVTAKMTPPKFIAALAGSGFKFNELSAKNVRRETAGTPAETLAEFRRVVTATSHPPGPADTWLGETVVHSEGIRRPRGIPRNYPAAAGLKV